MKKTKTLALFALSLLPGFAFASETAWTRDINCMVSGRDGANALGKYTLFSEVADDGTVNVVRSELEISRLQFVVDGRPGSVIENLVASTTRNGDGDDRWVSVYEETNSPRIKSISLTLTLENEEQNDSFVVTSKGNTYRMSCAVNGPSG